MACCSWGVITSCWPCLNSNFGASAIVGPDRRQDVSRGQGISDRRINEHVPQVDPPDVFVGYDFLRVTMC